MCTNCASKKGCCCGKRKVAIELRNEPFSGTGVKLFPKVIRNPCDASTNQYRWHFYKVIEGTTKRILIASTSYANSAFSLPMGQTSTNTSINLPNNWQDLYDWLTGSPTNAMINDTDQLIVQVELKNCRGAEVKSNFFVLNPVNVVVTDRWIKTQMDVSGDNTYDTEDLGSDPVVRRLSSLIFNDNGQLMHENDGFQFNSGLNFSFTDAQTSKVEVFTLQNLVAAKRLLFRELTPSVNALGTEIAVTVANASEIPTDLNRDTWLSVDGRKYSMGLGIGAVNVAGLTITWTLNAGYEIIGNQTIEAFGRVALFQTTTPIVNPTGNTVSVTLPGAVPYNLSNSFLMVDGMKRYEGDAIASVSIVGQVITWTMAAGYQVTSNDVEVIVYEP